MRRFDADDNDEFQDELEQMFEFEFEEGDFNKNNEIINVLQLDLVEYDLNQKLLAMVIKMLEKSFLWKFRSTKNKVREIAESYKKLLPLVDRTEKKTNEEESGGEDADISV